ncbi:GpE family phage tail protein [Sphingobium sp. SCG-1]|nr:GpE family phage tail protein [Sphingobium sp. SCG-1]
MADLAIINGWPLERLEAMTLEELLMWRGLAVDRWNRMYGERTKG